MSKLSSAKLGTGLRLMGVAAIALALSACELRREGAGDGDPATGDEEISEGDGRSLLDRPLLDEPLLDGGLTIGTEGDADDPALEDGERPTISIIREDVAPQAVRTPSLIPLASVIPFPDGGTDLGDVAERMLTQILESEQIAEDWPITLRGHTDSDGNDRANLRASRARAEAVAVWLVQRGVSDDRIEVVAIGEQNPAQPNALPDGTANVAGRAANRRVEVEIAPPVAEESDESTQSEADAGAE